jgi:seryl-tRNA synthetase
VLPLELIRRDPDAVKRAAELKGEEAPVDEILALDAEWRQCLTVAESARAQQNQLSKQFAKTKDPADMANAKQVGEEAKRELTRADELKKRLDELLLYVPNLFHESVPIGKSEADNVVDREWGEKRSFDFSPATHYDLGEKLGIMDFERSARVAGSRFAALSGQGARLERALVQFMLDIHTTEHGYTEMFTPFLVNSVAMIGTANLPKFGDQAFRLRDHDLWLVPTAEVPLTNWHRDELLDGRELPIRYVMYSPCWRSEAGAAGKDTRGYIRLHQFSKVEMVRITSEATSLEELETLTGHAEVILRRLGLPYRVLAMCTGDMGFAQYKKYDLEAWCPGLDRYLEVSSCSAFNDFQARRANIRYRPEPGAPPRFAHTINGSGLALTRTIDAVIENYQEKDGSIAIPDVLRPYMGGVERIG